MTIKKINDKNIPVIKVIGLGNILSGNDGIGIRIIQKLNYIKNKCLLLKDIDIIDLGTCGLDLLYYLENTDFVILIDAICINKKKGSILKIDGKYLINKNSTIKISSFHDISLVDVLTIGNEISKLPKIVMFGIAIDSINIVNNFTLNLTLDIDKEILISIDKIIPLIIKEIKLFIKMYYCYFDLNYESK